MMIFTESFTTELLKDGFSFNAEIFGNNQLLADTHALK